MPIIIPNIDPLLFNILTIMRNNVFPIFCCFVFCMILHSCHTNNTEKNINNQLEFETLRTKTIDINKIYPDSALPLSDSLFKVSKKSNSQQILANALSTMADVRLANAQLEAADSLNAKSQEINSKLKNNCELAKNYSISATIFLNRGNYVKSTELLLKSNEFCNGCNSENLVGYNYRVLSSIALNHEKISEAMDYAIKSISVKNKTFRSKALDYITIANVYLDKKMMDSAALFYSKSYQLMKDSNQLFSMAWVQASWAMMYSEIDIVKCGSMMKEAQILYDKIAPKSTFSINNLGNLGSVLFYISKEDSLINKTKNTIIFGTKDALLDSAEKYTKKSIAIAIEKNNTSLELSFKGYLSEIQAFRGDFKNAYDNLQSKFLLNESLFSQKNKNAIAKLEAEKELLNLKNENEKKSELLTLVLGCVLILIIIGFLSYKNIKHRQIIDARNAEIQKQKIEELEKNKQLFAIESVLKGQEEERGRIAKDLHDGLGGLLAGAKLSLNNIKEDLNLSTENNQKFEQTINLLDYSINDLRKITHNLMPETLSKFGLINALKDFCSSVQNASKISVTFQVMGIERALNETENIFIYRIIQELVSNAIKHASPQEIIVQLTVTNAKVYISVEDDGQGFNLSETKLKNTSGLNNIEYRVQYLNGVYDITSNTNQGTSINIELNV